MPSAGRREVGASCAGVSRVYGAASGAVPALVEVDAEFPVGALTVLAGPSGSGKSSLLRVVACQDRPDAGEVWIRGVEVSRLGARRRRLVRRREIGFVFQQPVENLVDYLTALEHVEWAFRLRGAAGGAGGGGGGGWGWGRPAARPRPGSRGGSSSAWGSPARWPGSRASSSPTSRPPSS